ncbi:MAG: AAA family ATPase [Geobacteraceae bacterium]|nr:AAA family ATPase [Geobacteraceae bacterium]
MYCNYFGFREKPFNITPNPRFLYLSKSHKEAIAHLLYGIKNHAGFIELTGEVGTGKTTILRTVLGELEEGLYRSALILNPCLSATELLRSINREFAIRHEGLENGELLDELSRFLFCENHAGKTVVLVIDEAQNLAPQVLEQIRLISNLETESDKLIQIILSGQPELAEMLAKPELRQLAQRITVRSHLKPLDFIECGSYIKHRILIAGGGGWISFSDSAVKKLFNYSKGSPRLMNIACDRALLTAFTEDSGVISANIAASAISEIKRPAGGIRSGRKVTLQLFIAALLIIATLIGAFMVKSSMNDVAEKHPAQPGNKVISR